MHTKKELLKAYITNNIDKIYRFAFSYAKNQSDAEDIVNESVKRALYSINSLKNKTYLSTWFYRILINIANTYLKSKSKTISLNDLTEETLVTEDNYQDTDIYNQVMQLDPKYRVVIVLRYYEDLALNQIAEILDTNINTVKTRLYKALDKLKVNMSKEDLNERFNA